MNNVKLLNVVSVVNKMKELYSSKYLKSYLRSLIVLV